FADIFATNCTKNSILPVALTPHAVEELMRNARSIHGYQLTVSLETCTVSDQRGFSESFSIDEFRKRCLWEGLDDIGLTLCHESEIVAWETQRAAAGLFPSTFKAI